MSIARFPASTIRPKLWSIIQDQPSLSLQATDEQVGQWSDGPNSNSYADLNMIENFLTGVCEMKNTRQPRMPIGIDQNRAIRVWLPAILYSIAIFLSASSFGVAQSTDSTTDRWWSDAVDARLQEAGDNRGEWLEALATIEPAMRPELEFLLQNMPERDLRSLTADFLLADIRAAHRIRQNSKWQIPDDLYFNDVLPYANVDEPRELWREKLHPLCQKIVAGCSTMSEAAQRLNEKLFPTLQVKYSTRRKRANQSPSETIEQGLASCTGLSILLVDACRSVGIPARLAGIPSWPNKRGNHTWVEIWDGTWHFTGAAEPSAQGLNHTWFQADAALAKKDSRLNAIYAVSFQQTDTTFPLVWGTTEDDPVYAVNVTERYAKPAAQKPAESHRLMVRVWAPGRQSRVATPVRLKIGDDIVKDGLSRGDTADMNDMLDFRVPLNTPCELIVQAGEDAIRRQMTFSEAGQSIVDVELTSPVGPSDERPNSRNETESIPDAELSGVENLRREVKQYFSADDLAPFEFGDEAKALYARYPRAMRDEVWRAYKNSDWAQMQADDYARNRVRYRQYTSPYVVREVGQRPQDGWPLFIAMHGGGGAPQEVNDSQWRIMQRYYKDQPEVTGYKYLALRAPNNTWNGFYDDYVYPLIENLIHQFLVFGDVNPNKVFIMGYSHGGYGAFAIGPKIPDRFAAIHASAAAPTDGETSAVTLRNTRFTFMVGENDNAYGRRERCERFAKQIEELKQGRDDIYPVEFLFQPGYGHGGLPDRDMIGQMYQYTRNPTPRHLTWEMTDRVVKNFFWLQVDRPDKGKFVEAVCKDNRIVIEMRNVDQLTVWFDHRLIDPTRPVTIEAWGRTIEVDDPPQLERLCQSLRRRGDIYLAFDRAVTLKQPDATTKSDE